MTCKTTTVFNATDGTFDLVRNVFRPFGAINRFECGNIASLLADPNNYNMIDCGSAANVNTSCEDIFDCGELNG